MCWRMGNRTKKRLLYISVDYRVHSYRGVQFRIWATKVLNEYIVKGFAMNDDLLKRAEETDGRKA